MATTGEGPARLCSNPRTEQPEPYNHLQALTDPTSQKGARPGTHEHPTADHRLEHKPGFQRVQSVNPRQSNATWYPT